MMTKTVTWRAMTVGLLGVVAASAPFEQAAAQPPVTPRSNAAAYLTGRHAMVLGDWTRAARRFDGILMDFFDHDAARSPAVIEQALAANLLLNRAATAMAIATEIDPSGTAALSRLLQASAAAQRGDIEALQQADRKPVEDETPYGFAVKCILANMARSANDNPQGDPRIIYKKATLRGMLKYQDMIEEAARNDEYVRSKDLDDHIKEIAAVTHAIILQFDPMNTNARLILAGFAAQAGRNAQVISLLKQGPFPADNGAMRDELLNRARAAVNRTKPIGRHVGPVPVAPAAP